MRQADVLFDGVTHIREELIEEAQQYVFHKKINWQRYAGGLAACLALVLGLSMLFRFGGAGGGAPSGPSGDSGAAEGGNGASSGDTAEPGECPAGALETSFTGDVLEVLEDGTLIVVPQPGSGLWSVADRVQVPAADVADMPDVQAGDRVLVVYTGEAGQDFVEGVVKIQILDGTKLG